MTTHICRIIEFASHTFWHTFFNSFHNLGELSTCFLVRSEREINSDPRKSSNNFLNTTNFITIRTRSLQGLVPFVNNSVFFKDI